MIQQIINCKDFHQLTNHPDTKHPCNKICQTQRLNSIKFLPEPHSGSLSADVIFIGSNPNINTSEISPTNEMRGGVPVWDLSHTVDFFIHRFKDRGASSYVDADFRVLERPYSTVNPNRSRPVQTWKRTHKRLNDFMRPLRREMHPGIDYSFIDIVKCKSSGEIGVKEALNNCQRQFPLFTNRGFSPKIIIALGGLARDLLRELFGAEFPRNGFGVNITSVNNIPSICLPHPIASMTAEYDHYFSDGIANEIRRIIGPVRENVVPECLPIEQEDLNVFLAANYS